MKKIIRLTEGDLHNIVKKSVNRILKEFDGYAKWTKQVFDTFVHDILHGAILGKGYIRTFDEVKIHYRLSSDKKELYLRLADGYENALALTDLENDVVEYGGGVNYEVERDGIFVIVKLPVGNTMQQPSQF